MTGELGSVLVESLQPIYGKEATVGEHGVKPSAGMTFTQDELVTIRGFDAAGCDVQYAAVKNGQDIGHRKRRAHVRASGSVSHANRALADAQRQFASGIRVDYCSCFSVHSWTKSAADSAGCMLRVLQEQTACRPVFGRCRRES